MSELDKLKILIYTGLNDVPRPASVEGAGNGSDMIARYNDLVDIVQGTKDPYFDNVSLLLPFHNDISDLRTRHTVVASGDCALTSPEVTYRPSIFSKFYDRSLRFNGGYLTVSDSLSDFNIRFTPFTIDCWIRPSDLIGSRTICSRTPPASRGGWVLYVDNGTKLVLSIAGSSIFYTNEVDFDFKLDQWHHVCVAFDGQTKWFMSVNGQELPIRFTSDQTSGEPYFMSGYNDSSTNFMIGKSGPGDSDHGNMPRFLGHINDFRWTKAMRKISSVPTKKLPTR